MGTRNNQGVMLNVSLMLLKRLLTSVSPVVLIVRLIIVKTIKVIVMVGIVVIAIYLIWVNISVPAIAGAKFVVSLKGDILSPK